VPRADVRQRQVEKEAIQIGIIKRVAALDQRHMRIEALGLAALVSKMIDTGAKPSPGPPPGS
jgi:hypothetical protein